MAKRRDEDFFGKLNASRAPQQADEEEEATSGGATGRTTPVRRRNRQRKGKKYDARYRQVTAYIRRDIHTLVKYASTGKTNDRGKDLEFSELVESLLLEWAEEQGWSLEELEERQPRSNG